MGHKISAIVLTYNTDYENLKRTLSSIIDQKNINFEIIISDDGTLPKWQEKVESYFEERNFPDHKILLHRENEGTVRNIIKAVQAADGEYIAAISPGDMAYDENTFSLWAEQADKEKCDICFGVPLYYYKNGEKIEFSGNLVPQMPGIYNEGDDRFKFETMVFGDWINGVSYLRKRTVFLEYLKRIEGRIRYVEDTTTSLLMLADGVKFCFFERPVVWYESGVGISTNAASRTNERLKNDFSEIRRMLTEKNPGYDRLFECTVNIPKYKRFLKRPFFMLKRNKEKKIEFKKYSGLLKVDEEAFMRLYEV